MEPGFESLSPSYFFLGQWVKTRRSLQIGNVLTTKNPPIVGLRGREQTETPYYNFVSTGVMLKFIPKKLVVSSF
jgi:hypothetical protein